MKPNVQLIELAVFVHGILASFHLLGVAYNLRRRNWWDVGVHTAATVYDIHSVMKHVQQLTDAKAL